MLLQKRTISLFENACTFLWNVIEIFLILRQNNHENYKYFLQNIQATVFFEDFCCFFFGKRLQIVGYSTLFNCEVYQR